MVCNDIGSCIPCGRQVKECIGEEMYIKTYGTKNGPLSPEGRYWLLIPIIEIQTQAKPVVRLSLALSFQTANMRSIAQRARSAISSGTVMRGCREMSAFLTLFRSVFFIFVQIASRDRG